MPRGIYKRKQFTEEHKRSIGGSNRIAQNRPEVLEKQRISHLGRKYSLESRQKMSEAQKGEKSHMFGKFREKHHRWTGGKI